MGEHTYYDQFPGKIVGNYRLEQLIETHAWGPVFQACDRSGRQYVVRFLDITTHTRRDQRSSEERLVILGRLQQEANRVSALLHPHIISPVEYGTYQGMLYLTYPDLSYPLLCSKLHPKTLPDLLTVGRFLEQIANALEYAYEHAVLHRNLSTGCIFLSGKQQIAVGEFGLLRMRELCLSGIQPVRGQTYPYEGSSESCAPEQLLGRVVDMYTDVYALGSVLYRLLTGYTPFQGHSRDEILRQHLYARIPKLRERRSDLPEELEQVITRTLAKEPEQRYIRPRALVQAYYQIVSPKTVPQLSLKTSASLPIVSSARATRHLPERVMSHNTSNKGRVTRRNFILLTGAGTLVAATAVGAGAHFLSSHPAANSAPQAAQGMAATGNNAMGNVGATPTIHSNGKVLAKTANVAPNSALKFALPNQNNPGLLIHLPDQRFVAFDSTCTHAGCAVDYDPQEHLLNCPCHGAVFDPAKNAEVVQGPANTPLKAIKIMVGADGTITTD